MTSGIVYLRRPETRRRCRFHSLMLMILLRRNSCLFTGSCPNSLVYNIGHGFSTKDRDISGKNCTVLHRGAWWYSSKQNDCTKTNLNGLYTPPHGQLKTGIYWYKTGKVIERLEATQMLLQPLV